MPKLKTHSGSKERVKVTKNGKLLVRKGFGNHFLEKKDKSRKRTFSGFKVLSGRAKHNIRQKIGV
jgi:large subunit ribosomal protein L35